jgi:uncharacterized membrane protein YdjX (TVP38/TMEM64 family)
MRNKKILKLSIIFIWVLVFYILLFNKSLSVIMLSYCISHPIQAPFFLIITHLILSSLLLPCSPITILAGILWGFNVGLIYSIISTILASTWTFYLSRFPLRLYFSNYKNNPNWKRISVLVEKHGWAASFLAYINPILPASSLGLFFGLTELNFMPFLLGAGLGNLPLQIIQVYFGSYIR